MCEHFVARADEPFRIDELWPFAERLERFGIAGFGWGAAWRRPDGRLDSYRDMRALRDDPSREAVGANETTSLLVHLRRPSKLSTLTMADTQPFPDPRGRFVFSHNGDLRDVRSWRARFRAEGRIHGRADTEVGQRWLEDAWSPGEPVAGRLAEALFAVGLFGASVLAATIMPLSTAFVICEAFGWESGVDKRFSDARAFFSIYTFVLAGGALVVLIPGLDLLPVIIASQNLQGLLLPVVLVFMVLLVNDARLMGAHRNGRVGNLLAWSAIGLVIVLDVVLLGVVALGLVGIDVG